MLLLVFVVVSCFVNVYDVNVYYVLVIGNFILVIISGGIGCDWSF